MLTILKKIPVILGVIVIIAILVLFSFINIVSDLPDYKEFEDYQYLSITRLYSNDQQILDEFADERRVYVPYDRIPRNLINAFVAVEDKNYFHHQGIDFLSIFRASFQNIINLFQNKRLVGGSTITQQVVKGFFLTNERSISRKIKEALLAYRINKIASKEKILEVYLNQIYLGRHSYGIYVAAQNYFGKELNDLDIEEVAMLASLPKAPSSLNPYVNYDKAIARRNWSIKRMYEESYINEEEKNIATEKPINLSYTRLRNNQYENYYTEAVKGQVLKMFGSEYLFHNGLMVNTNVNLEFQKSAQKALRAGLREYDKKNGWRGSFAYIDEKEGDIKQALKNLSRSKYHDNYRLAYIKKVSTDYLDIMFEDGVESKIKRDNLQWVVKDKKISNFFKIGEVILLDKHNNIMQIPKVNGAMVVIENKTGKILSMVGGYDLRQSHFNRAIQAKRQPGSVFKTFVYLAALEQGEAPNTLLLDEPMEIDLGHGLPKYIPKNYKDIYKGVVTLRRSFERSLNLSSIRLLMGVGLDKVKDVAVRYNIYPKSIKATYSMALGAYETTLLKITNAYASIGNGGIMMRPKLIDSIYNRNGNLIYAANDIFCDDCHAELGFYNTYPKIRYVGQKMTDSATNYQTLSLLEGAVQRGSSMRAKWLKKVVAGKTGTTNDSKDAWFIGITPDITVGVYVGFDEPRSLGKNISGSNLAVPIFNNFIISIKNLPDKSFPIPESIEERHILLEEGDVITEEQAEKLQKTKAVIKEFFKKRNYKTSSNKNFSNRKYEAKNFNSADENMDIFSFAEPHAAETDGM